jgi:hypothetical protein
MEFLLAWVLFAIVPGLIAHWRGRSARNWFLLALLISPLIAFVILLFAPDLKKEREQQEAAAQRIPCPFCSEAIMKTARICPHCRSELSSAPVERAEAAKATTQPKSAPVTPVTAQTPKPGPSPFARPPAPRPAGPSPLSKRPGS